MKIIKLFLITLLLFPAILFAQYGDSAKLPKNPTFTSITISGTGLSEFYDLEVSNYLYSSHVEVSSVLVASAVQVNNVFNIPHSVNLPTTCNVGDIYMDTNATSGQRCYLCESANTWMLQGDGTGAGGGDPVLIDTVAIADGSGVDFTSGTGIDLTLNSGVSPDTTTVNFDSTEIEATTWGAGGNASNIWTHNLSGATDPAMTFANNDISINTPLSGFTGLNSSGSSALGGSLYNLFRTSSSAGLGGAAYVNYSYAFSASDLPFATVSYLKNTGTTVATAGYHGGGLLAWATDTATANATHMLFGMEGRVDGLGTNTNYVGNNNIANWWGNDTTYNGTIAGTQSQVSVYQSDQTTPLAQGTAYAFYAPAITGGASKFSFYGEDPLKVVDTIYSFDAAGTKSNALSHDGTDGYVTSSSGNLRLAPAVGSYLVAHTATGFAPGTDGIALGVTGLEWGTAYINSITSDTGTVSLPVGATIATGENLTIGVNQLNSGDLLDGTKVANADLGDIGVSSGVWTVENAAVIGKVITGFTSGAGALAGTDTILQAIQKLDGNVGTKQATVTEGSLADSVIVSADIKDGTIAGGDLASNIAVTSTGAQDYGGATSFEIPNGANPTVSVAGQVSTDTSVASGCMVRFYGDAQYSLPAWQSKSFVIIAPVATDDYPLWQLPFAITIKKIRVQCTGGTNIIGQLDEYDSEGAVLIATVDGDITATAANSVDDDGSLTNPGISAGNYLFWHTTSISSTPSSVTVTIDYIVDSVN